MMFEYPDYLWLLLIAPAMAFFFWWSGRARQKLMARFIQARLLPELVAGLSSTRQRIRAVLLIGSVVCLVIALARPQWGYDLDEVRQRGLDIMIAIDTSKSMLAEDIAPNRLARAKLAALDLMQQAKLDRLGLIAFAGTAFLQCPLTVDDAAFRESVESLDVNTLPQGGTAIAEAIDTAVKCLKGEDNHKVLVLFTDGEDQDSGALAAARRAADAGLKIFTIGVGTSSGEILRVKNAHGEMDYVRDENGNAVKSRLNESLLKEIATATSASYLPLRGANTMDMLYQQGLAPLPKSDFKESWVRRPRERYHWPLALAILLLMGETVLPERRKKRRSVTAKKEPLRAVPAQAALFVVLLLLLPLAARASTAGALREYKSGNYTKAYEEYERLLRKNADDARLHFNAGAAAYRDQQFSTAARHFGEALNSQDLKLQETAYYNLGNALFRLGEQNTDASKKSEAWEKSLTNYLSSLKLDANDADARHNYDFVKQQLEELKKQQQQQQQQQKQNNQSKENQSQQQQNQQAKNDQQQKGSEPQSQQDQKQNNSQESQQQAANQKPEQEKEQAQSQQQQQPTEQEKQDSRTNDQEKKSNSSGQAAEARATSNGEMTPQQAERLLDAQKDDEKMLPLRPPGSPQQRPIRDW